MQGRASERTRSRARINESREFQQGLKLRPISARGENGAIVIYCVSARLIVQCSYERYLCRPCTGHVAGVPLFTRSLTRGGGEEVDSTPFLGSSDRGRRRPRVLGDDGACSC